MKRGWKLCQPILLFFFLSLFLYAELAEEAVNKLYKLLDATNTMLSTAGCLAIGVMGRFSPLPIPDSPSSSTEKSDKEEKHVTKKDVLDKLIVLLQHTERTVRSYFLFFFPLLNLFF
jgi:hypothetical protein